MRFGLTLGLGLGLKLRLVLDLGLALGFVGLGAGVGIGGLWSRAGRGVGRGPLPPALCRAAEFFFLRVHFP